MVDIANIRAPLFVPANRPDRFGKAAATQADAVILDLEDAVAADEKDAARDLLRSDFTDKPVIVRINAYGTRWHDADVAAVRKMAISAVILPKAQHVDSIAETCRSLGGHAPVMALIETALGLANCRQIASIPEIGRLLFGSIDYCADLGCDHTARHCCRRVANLFWLRALPVSLPRWTVLPRVWTIRRKPLTTRAMQRRWEWAASFASTRSRCPPSSAPTPSNDEITWARRVLASGDGAVSIDGAMIDEPVRQRARDILGRLSTDN